MIIGIDIRPLMHGKISGIEVYIRNLLKHLPRDKGHEYILYYNAWEKAKGNMHFEGMKTVHSRIPNKLFYLTSRFLRWPKIDTIIKKKTGKQIDVLFMPDPRPCDVSKKAKMVVTYHDLSFVRYGQFFSRKSRAKYLLMNPRKLAERADHIIAVSHFTKQELEEVFHIPNNKITVILEGPGDALSRVTDREKLATVHDKYRLPEKFFLSLSHLEPRKNLPYLINAYIQWRAKTKHQTDLVVAGMADPSIFQDTYLPKDPHIHYPGFIANEDKAALYSLAEGFMYPSLYEGFGLPLLEAMQCETPIITSRGSSLTEVGGDAVLFIDPHDEKTLVAAMEQVSNSETQIILKEKMRHHVAKFSWKKCAEETVQLVTKI